MVWGGEAETEWSVNGATVGYRATHCCCRRGSGNDSIWYMRNIEDGAKGITAVFK
jgi:hypothetical protein